MKRTLALVLALLAGSQSTARAQRTGVYALDAGHSIFEFSIGFAFSRVKGRFVQTHGTMAYDAADPAKSSVAIVAESNSIDTGWPHRDEHLKTSDFFDVEKYPAIIFQSTRLRPNGKDWLMDGKLTMHGITKDITVPLVLRPPQRSPESRWMILNATSTFKLARKDFEIFGGAKYNSWFDAARQATMSDTVDVNIEVEGYWGDAASQRSAPLVDALNRVKTSGVSQYLDRVKAALAGKPDSVLMNYFTGPDLMVRELIEEDRPKALELASALPNLFKGASAYAVYGWALAVNGDTAGARRQYAEAKRVFRPPVPDPTVKFKQVDERWYWLDQLVKCSIERGHTTAAVDVARLTAELYANNARAHATYGWALSESGDRKNAAAEIARALEIDPLETAALRLSRRILPADRR